jgi:hypothetical protein
MPPVRDYEFGYSKKNFDIFLGQLVVRHTEGREHTWPEHTQKLCFLHIKRYLFSNPSCLKAI